VTSAPVRDQLDDHLITPENAAFLFIDYQPSQLATIRSMDPALLIKNARTASGGMCAARGGSAPSLAGAR
jgi:hypothetical protein